MVFRNRLIYITISFFNILTDLLLINFILIKNTDLISSKHNSALMLFLIIIFNLLWIVLHFTYRLNKFYRVKKRKNLVFNTLNAFFIFLVLFIFLYGLIYRSWPFDPFFFPEVLLLATAICISKLFFDATFKFLSAKGYLTNRVLIVGYSENTEILKNFILNNPWAGLKYIGYVQEGKVNGNDCLSDNYNDILSLIKTNQINEIFVNMEVLNDQIKHSLVEIAANYPVKIHIVPDLAAFPPYHHSYQRFDQTPVISVGVDDFTSAFNKLLKQVFDITVTLIAFLVLLWWLIPFISLLIKLDSKGPVFFRQIRVGYKNKLFTCLKFRTMYVNKEADKLQARMNDERVTRIGKFLRKYSLDEIPQFFNVLVGQMSLVGPRPHMLYLNEKFSQTLPFYQSRHRVKPGMTGLAQVRGYRGETKNPEDMAARIKFDIFYIENWSIWLDIKIILLTLKNILTGESMGY